ncbi:hypothetical protein [Arthrobacter sp. StoSoilB5]|uniref:hypothetical protein n=1 Tax=Arthrobacter sp. StoSoilB5 TaxID=2830992 RepID=UPI001CC4C329|nr:hypothetical protein [Arthrobacter sp. StoSoilB5]
MVGNDNRSLKVQRPGTVHQRALETRGPHGPLPWRLHLNNLIRDQAPGMGCDVAS